MKKFFTYTSIFIFSWLYSLIVTNADWDLWARLAVGKIFFQTGSVLKQDIFSYTPNKEIWIDHEWGSGVIFYFLAHHFGDLGLILFKLAGFLIILILISKIIKLQNVKPDSHLNLLFYFLIILAIFNGVGATVRCQEFTFVFFTLWIYILELVRRGNNKLLWIFPATMLIWANVHGGFVAGLGLLGIYGLGEFLNKKPYSKYFLILIPTVLITLINPYGIQYWDYIIHATTMDRSTIAEWKPTNLFGHILQWKGFKAFLIVSLTGLIYSLTKAKPDFKTLDKVKYILMAVTLYLSLKHIKHQPFYVIAAGSFLYHDFYMIFESLKSYLVSKFGTNFEKTLKYIAITKETVVFTLVILLGSLLIYSNPIKVEVHELKYPVGSIEFIKQNNLSGNLATVFQWGSYAAWKLYPQCLVAIDGRYEEVYPEHLYQKVHNFIHKNNKNWYDFVKEYHTDIIILNKEHKSYPALLKEKFWKQIYDDKISAVFIPAHKAKKEYIFPKIDKELLIKTKYENKIDF